jgi:hypothetical protein
MDLAMTAAETRVLRETLEQAADELLLEIARTDHRKMRDSLKERETVLKRILAMIPEEAQSAA